MEALNSERRGHLRARGGKEERVFNEITYYPPLTNLEFISEIEDANEFKIEPRGIVSLHSRSGEGFCAKTSI